MLKALGLPYFYRFLTKYTQRYRMVNFAGNLPAVKAEYRGADSGTKAQLTARTEEIINSIVLPNGVTKTTFSGRQNATLSELLKKKYHLNKSAISVLDIPSSIGLASLGIYRELKTRYELDRYVLADLYFEVLYDHERGCIFDASGNLLQVRGRKRFFSINLPHVSGDAYGILARCLLLPMNLRSRYLVGKYKMRPSATMRRILLLHPEVEKEVDEGTFQVENIDIFSTIEGNYDLILSFNLLQKNSFPEDQIEAGIENLQSALNESGLLVMGNTQQYSIARKIEGKLVELERSGDF
jgi:hypothetical protein